MYQAKKSSLVIARLFSLKEVAEVYQADCLTNADQTAPESLV